MTLYHLTSEKGRRIRCTGACATFWPPLLVRPAAKPQAGRGVVKAKLGTVKRPDGRRQVTFAGLALYRYAGDKRPGQATGQGVQRSWYAIGPDGKLVRRLPASG